MVNPKVPPSGESPEMPGTCPPTSEGSATTSDVVPNGARPESGGGPSAAGRSPGAAADHTVDGIHADELDPQDYAWAYNDTLPGDGAVRELLAYLDHVSHQPAAVEPALFRALGDALGGRTDAGRLHRSLLRVLHGQRAAPRSAAASSSYCEDGYPGPLVRDEDVLGTAWRLDDLIDVLTTLREDLLSPGAPNPTNELLDKIVNIERVLEGRTSLREDGRLNRQRTTLINNISIVAELRLPTLLRRLAERGRLSAEPRDRFLGPLLDDASCVVGLVRARDPDVAADLDSEASKTILADVIASCRDSSGGGRWPKIADLMISVSLWPPPPGVQGGAFKADFAVGEKVRNVFQQNELRIGDLAKARNRKVIWPRLSEFVLLVGLGVVEPSELEAMYHLIRDGG